MRKRAAQLLLLAALLTALAVPARAADGTWPDMQMGRTRSVQTKSGVVHTMLVLQEDGALWGWGNMTAGELGNGGRYDQISQCGDSTIFYQVDGPELVMSDVAFADLGAVTSVVQRDGSLWYSGAPLQARAWDEIEYQQEFTKLADGIVSAASFLYRDHSFYHPFDVPVVLALDGDGTLWSYRWEVEQVQPPNMAGDQRGLYRFDLESRQKVMDGVEKVVAGVDHALCLTETGEVYAWGDWYNGQLGDGRIGDPDRWLDYVDDPSLTFADRPVYVLSGAADLFAGAYCSGAVLEDGTCLAWGQIEVTEQSSAVPVQIADGVRSVSYDSGVTALVMQDGTLWCMGMVSAVFRDLPDSTVPVPTGIGGVVQAASNSRTVSYIREDGSLWAAGELYGSLWGYEWNDYEFAVQDGARYSPSLQITGYAPDPQPFSDVSPQDYFADAVAWAKENDITGGTSATTFSPASTVTRAEAVTFLWRAAGRPEPASPDSPFTDVTDRDAYYYKAVLWAAEQGITNGVSATVFGTDRSVAYDQILAFLARTAGADTGSGDWSQAAIDWAAENGLTDGLTFSAKNICPRSDVVYCLWQQIA